MKKIGSIYKITNSASGNFYIGATVMPIQKRFRAHILNLSRGNHYYKNKMMYEDYIKYGAESFSITSIEDVYEGCSIKDTEQKWINKYISNPKLCNAKTTSGYIESPAPSTIARLIRERGYEYKSDKWKVKK